MGDTNGDGIDDSLQQGQGPQANPQDDARARLQSLLGGMTPEQRASALQEILLAPGGAQQAQNATTLQPQDRGLLDRITTGLWGDPATQAIESGDVSAVDPRTGSFVPPGQRRAVQSELADQQGFDQRASQQEPTLNDEDLYNIVPREDSGLITGNLQLDESGRGLANLRFPAGPQGHAMMVQALTAGAGHISADPQTIELLRAGPENFPGASALADRQGFAAINTQHFDPGSLQNLINQGLRLGSSGSGQGPTGRRTEIELSGSVRGSPPDWLRELQLGTNEKLQALRQSALEGRLDARAFAQEGGSVLAQLREAQIEAQREFDSDAADQLQRRLTGLDTAIDNVESGRVDPEAFFGEGGGRRVAFGVALALGALGSALTGNGPNRAMEVLQGRVDAHIQAQRANLANRRAVAGMRGGALRMFQSALGNERAAEEALRAAEYGAALARLRSRVESAQDPVIRDNGNALILAVRAQQLQAMANAYASTETEYEVSQTLRTQQDPRQLVQSMMNPQAQAQRPAARRGSGGRRSGGDRTRPRPQLSGQGLGSFESSDANAVISSAQATIQSPGSDAPRTLAAAGSGNVQQIWNRLDDTTRTRFSVIAEEAPRVMNAMRTLIRYADSIGPGMRWGRDGDTESARLAAEQLQAAFRRQAEFGALTGNERDIASAIANAPTDEGVLEALRGRSSPSAIRGLTRQWMTDYNAQLSARALTLNTAGRNIPTEGE